MAGESHQTHGSPEVQVHQAWLDLIALLEADTSWRMLIIVGLVDTGKTTFCRHLGRELAKRYLTAAIDCDPGQSAIGPPTTVSLGREPWTLGAEPLALRFVGSTSPMRHFLQALSGIRRLADLAAAEGFQKILLDSSGHIDNDAGREFQFQVVDTLQPDHLVVFQRAQELEPVLACFPRRAKPRVHRLPISQAAIARLRPVRQLYREARLGEYFRDAAPRTLDLDGIGFHGMISNLDSPPSYRNRLVALCDRQGFAVVLAILEQLDGRHGRMHLFCPHFDPRRIATVQFGSISLERSGRQIHA